MNNVWLNRSRPVFEHACKGRLSLYLWLGISITILLQLGIRLSGHISHDVAWYLLSVGRMLDGAVLYKDVFEVNPPLAFWLMSPPVAFHRLTNIDSIVSTYLYLLTLILFASLLVNRVLAQKKGLQESHRALIVWLVVACCAFVPGSEFAQREHLMIVLLTPYLALSALRLDGENLNQKLAVFVGVVAATGLCLKPHMMAIPLSIEVYILLRERNLSLTFRPENIAILITILLYLVAILVFTPEYLSIIVPIAMDTYSSTYRLAESIFRARIHAVVSGVLLVVLAAILLKKQDALTGVLLAATIGALISYTAQQKGFRYHIVPAYVLILLAAGTLLLSTIYEADYTRHKPDRSRRKTLLGIIILIAVLATGASTAWERQHYRVNPTVINFLDKYAPNAGSVFVASAHPSISFPAVVEKNIIWASRFPAQWLIPGIAIARHEAKLSGDLSLRHYKIEAFARDSAVEDFLHYNPDMVLIDIREKKTYFGDAKFDYLSFYKEDGRFVEFWANYKLVSGTVNFEMYCLVNPANECASS